MPGIVDELQRDALERSVRLSDLLRKALLVARKLNVSEIETWLLSELNGYTNAQDVPAYRKVKGQLKAFNPYTGAHLPIMFEESDSEDVERLTNRTCNQSVAEIEALISSGTTELAMGYSPQIAAQLRAAAQLPSPPSLHISTARFHGILDAVRTAVLDWALKLEEEGVIGEGLSFSDAERKAASHVVINIGSMSHSQIQAETIGSKQYLVSGEVDPAKILAFVTQIRCALSSLSLQSGAVSELNGEIGTLEAQAKSSKPKQGIIKESLRSVRTILEGAAGNVAAEGLLQTIRILIAG